MLILAVDTSGSSISSALWQDGRLLAEMTGQTGQPHSVTLMPLISQLLAGCGLGPASPDAYACAVGPGSYTGIRIGVSAVKAMAYAAGKPAVGISTLEAMAWPYAACPGLLVCPMIDARNERVYGGAWLAGSQVLPAANIDAADFARQVTDLSGQPDKPCSILLVGHQPAAFFQSCGKPVQANIHMAPAFAAMPRASAMAELAECRLMQGDPGLPQQLMPQYLSASQAERKRAAANA